MGDTIPDKFARGCRDAIPDEFAREDVESKEHIIE